MTNSARSYARYILPLRATDRAEFRTISGFATAPLFNKCGKLKYLLLDFKRPQNILGISEYFEACCEGPK